MDCWHPREIKLPDGRLQVVRCGKCLPCLEYRQAGWITRLRVQLEANPDTSYFVTLTYDDASLPFNVAKYQSDDAEYLDKVPSVRKADLVKFHKDLRKRFQQGFFYDHTLSKCNFGEPQRIVLPHCEFQFYCTSEYGPKGHRPHYHGVYFGLPADADLTFDLFNEIWNKGFVYCEKASSDKAAAYVTKYLVNTSLVPVSVHAERPWSLMSKGLGSVYLTDTRKEWHRQAPVLRSYVPNGAQRSVLPRYFREKLFDDEMKAELLQLAIDREAALLDSPEGDLEVERHFQEEALRQAYWRFQKSGKIK